MIWQVVNAKAQLSEILDHVSEEGPQIVTYREKRYVIAEEMAEEEFSPKATRKMGLLDYFRSGPSFDGVTIESPQSLLRDVEL